jgi:hypothetical protein
MVAGQHQPVALKDKRTITAGRVYRWQPGQHGRVVYPDSRFIALSVIQQCR